MPPCVLTADIGTGSLKCACVDFDGRLISFSRKKLNPAPKKKILFAEDWEIAFADALDNIFDDTGRGQGKPVPEAVCISGNGPTLVPVTFQNESLAPLHWFDKKKPVQGCLSFFLPGAAWFKENEPSAYRQAKWFLSPHDWLIQRLGAEPVTSIPAGAYTPYYWDEDQFTAFDLDKAKFPPFVKMGTVIGKLSPQAAGRFGIKAGTPLVSGAPDFISAIIGTGALMPGAVCDRAGTSEGINLCVSEKLIAEGLRTFPHAKEGLINLGAVIPESGRLFEKYLESCGRDDYKSIFEELIPKNYTAKDWPQVFSSAAQDHLEKGRLTLMEIGFSVYSALKKFKDTGFDIKEMTVSGGQGKNPLWNQLKADMTGAVLSIPEIVDAELAGNAVLSAMALGEVSNIEAGAERMIRIKEKFFPQEERSSFWKEKFAQRTAQSID